MPEWDCNRPSGLKVEGWWCWWWLHFYFLS
jgi:hypothetical protein